MRCRSGPMALAFVLLVSFLLAGTDVLALGTASGTTVTSTATVSGTIGGSPFSQTASSSFTVDEVLDLTLTWQDAGPVSAAPGQSSAVTTFLLTNTGNGNDTYTLTATGAGIGGDQFDPTVTAIYLDANGNSTFEPATDTLYTGGTGTVASEGFHTVFVLSSIPAGTLNTGDLGTVQLIATSTTGTGPAGTILPGAGDSGTDAVIGGALGTQTAAGSYVISSLATVNVAKTAAVTDPYGGNRPQPGATIRYTLTVTVSGTGAANGIVITDAIPPNTNYAAGTLTLDAAPLGDSNLDGDAGDVGATTPNTVTVTLGSLTSASPARIITFDVTIN